MDQLPSLFLGVWGVLIFWLAGNKNVWAWRLGLLGQVWWASYALWLDQYGLLVSCALYGGVYLRNLLLWKENRRPPGDAKGAAPEGTAPAAAR